MKKILNLKKLLAFRNGTFWADEQQKLISFGQAIINALDYNKNPNHRKCTNYANQIDKAIKRNNNEVEFENDEYEFIKKAALEQTLYIIPAYIKTLMEDNFNLKKVDIMKKVKK